MSLSWGGPATFPHRYEAGKRQLENAFGVEVVEMPNTLAEAATLVADPAARASDLRRAFADPDIAGVVSTIGGDDSIRLLPHLDLELVAPELDRGPWRRLWVLADGDRRVAHLHLVQADHPRFQQTLAFRDRLRQQPALAQQYEHLKRTAAQEYRSDREDYTDAKAAFIRSVVADLM